MANISTNFETWLLNYGDRIYSYLIYKKMFTPYEQQEAFSDESIYEDRERLCVISCDSHDKYNHPDPSVLSAIKGKSSIPLIVTEQTMTKQEFTINLPQ